MNLKNCCCNLKSSPFSVTPEISLLQLSYSYISCLKKTIGAADVNKLGITDSIDSLLFTTIVGDDKLEIEKYTFEKILDSWTLHLYCSKLITLVSIEQNYVYNFHRYWMADNNKFIFLVAKVSFKLISTIIDCFSYNLLSIHKSFSALLCVATRLITNLNMSTTVIHRNNSTFLLITAPHLTQHSSCHATTI